MRFEVVDSFTANGFVYKHSIHPITRKPVFSCTPEDESLSPRALTAKEYKAIKREENLGNFVGEISPTTQASAGRYLIPHNAPNVAHSNPHAQNYAGYHAHLVRLCKEHNIEMVYHKHEYGRACHTPRQIWIHAPTNAHFFLVGLHEIAHVVLDLFYHKMRKAVAEYQAEMWAIHQGLSFGVPTEDMLEFREMSKRYLRFIIIKQARLKNFKPESIPVHISEYAELNPYRLVGTHFSYDRFDDNLVIHHLEDCKRYTVTHYNEVCGPYLVKSCLACGRKWFSKNPAYETA